MTKWQWLWALTSGGFLMWFVCLFYWKINGKSLFRRDFLEVVCGGALVIVSFWLIEHFEHSSSDGEPLSFHEGISIWPATLIREIAGILAIVFGLDAWRRLKKMRVPMSSGRVCVPAYSKYVKDVTSLPELQWLCGAAILYLSSARLVFQLAEEPANPHRGWRADIIGFAILVFVVMCHCGLTVFVIHAALRCRHFVRQIGDHVANWSDEFMEKLFNERFSQCGVSGRATRELCTVRVIAEVTATISRLISYPFIILCLLIVSRATFFDFLPINVPLALFWIVMLGTLLFLAFDIGRQADVAREHVLCRLRGQLICAPSEEGTSSNQIRAIIDEIRGERDGAFRPFIQSPLFWAISLPLGGTSGLMLVEQFLLKS